MGGLFGVGDCKESSYKCLCKRVRFVFNMCSSATMRHILTWRSIKETLKKEFARAAEGFIYRLQQIEQAIGALAGPLPVSF